MYNFYGDHNIFDSSYILVLYSWIFNKKKTWYKIMFRLIEQVFIALLSFSGSLARMSLIS